MALPLDKTIILEPQIKNWLREYHVVNTVLESIHGRALKSAEFALTSYHRVSCLSHVIHPGMELFDALKNRLPELEPGDYGDAIAIQVDLEPSANWGHPCWLATFQLDRPDQPRLLPRYFPFFETADSRLVTIV